MSVNCREKTIMAHKPGTDRNQLLLFPPGLDEYIGKDNPVKDIDVFVDSPGFKMTGFKNSIPLEKSCPPYNSSHLPNINIYVAPRENIAENKIPAPGYPGNKFRYDSYCLQLITLLKREQL